ncbi:MAG: hypothetical protein ACRBI6_21730 [Acidimicrobiales bacterium]
MSHIGTLNEGSLHVALKQLVAEPGDEFEVPLHGFVIDIVRAAETPDECLIEIQTGSFAAMGTKLDRLLDDHRIHLVHPIALRTTLERPGGYRRRSPRRQSLHSVFEELVSVPTLLDHPGLTLEVVLVEATKTQIADPRARRGRGGWRTVDRRLDTVVERHRFDTLDDVAALLPDELPSPFTTADVAERAPMPRDLAQKACYCLRATGHLVETGRTRAGVTYERARPSGG